MNVYILYHIIIYLKSRTLPDPTQMRATEGETDNRPREGTLYLSRVSHRHRTTHLHRFSQFYCYKRHVEFPWLHCSCPDTTIKYNMKQRFCNWILGSTFGTSITDFFGHDVLHTLWHSSILGGYFKTYQPITDSVKGIFFSCDGKNDLLCRCQSQTFHNRPVCHNVYHFKKFYKVYLLSSSIMFQTTISTT